VHQQRVHVHHRRRVDAGGTLLQYLRELRVCMLRLWVRLLPAQYEVKVTMPMDDGSRELERAVDDEEWGDEEEQDTREHEPTDEELDDLDEEDDEDDWGEDDETENGDADDRVLDNLGDEDDSET
jgi:hypothetical protein